MAYDLNHTLTALADTLLWVLFGTLLAAGALVVIDKVTPKWFHLRSIGDNANATAIFASGIVVGVAVIVGAVILSPTAP